MTKTNKTPVWSMFLTVITVLLAVGCSMGGGDGVPVMPVTTPQILGEATDGSSGHYLWNLAEIRCDIDSGKIEVIPLRSESVHLNVAKTLMASMGMKVTFVPGQSDPSKGIFAMDISLKHPFTGKPKFSGFDVKGILMTPGSLNLGSIKVAGLGETELLNRDGLTRWWNPTEFTGSGLLGYFPGKPGNPHPALLTATVNPFKAYADSLTAEDPLDYLNVPALTDDTGRAVFSAGKTNTRRYIIQFPMSGGPVIIFNYAIDAHWNAPSPNPPVQVPDDFPIIANEPEPFIVELSFPKNTLQYIDGGTVEGELKVRAAVSDWQGIAAGIIHDQISVIRISAPTLFNGEIDLDFVEETALQATYEADLTPSLNNLVDATPHYLLARVEASGAGNYKQGGTTTGPSDPISAYQAATVKIVTVTCQADTNNDFSEAVPLPFGEKVEGTVCSPDGDLTDFHDFYSFAVFPGGVFGSLYLTCTGEPTSIALYDPAHTKIAENSASGGKAKIDVDTLGLSEGTYYVEVSTQNESQIVVYTVDNKISANPCGETIAFNYETQVDDIALNKVEVGRHSIVVDGQDLWIVYSQGDTSNQEILVRHSPNGGGTFDAPVVVSDISATGTRRMPSIARGTDGRLYCAWVDLSSGNTAPTVDVSANGGLTWGTDVNLYDFETGSLSVENSATGIIVKADPLGRVHAVWADARKLSNHLYYMYSDDQAVTWQTSVKVDDSNYGLYASPEVLDADVSSDGNFYVVWSDARHETAPPHSNRDIFIDVRTHAGGFGTDVMVNTQADNVQQEFPAVAVGNDGVIHCAWSDNRNAQDNGGPNPINTFELFYARSVDGGTNWENEQKIPEQSPGYNSFGDINPRIAVSPWGNPYISYVMKRKEIHINNSCDGGATWDDPVVAYVVASGCSVNHNVGMGLIADGTVFLSYIDSRAQSGYPPPYWNVWMSRSD
jgi:hypothetical protein